MARYEFVASGYDITPHQVRMLLRTSKVRLGHIPPWLATRLREAQAKGSFDGHKRASPVAMLGCCARAAKEERHRWLLNYGSSMCDGKECFVAEPPKVTAETLASVRRFANLLGVKWELSPNSWAKPGHTFRLTFYEG